MNKTKTLLQQVQSRISKRRNSISSIENELRFHFYLKEMTGLGMLSRENIEDAKDAIKTGAASQKLDKSIYKILMNLERSKYDVYFRSNYPSVKFGLLEGEKE